VSVNYKSWPFPSVLWYCWLGHKTCKNCRPYNLYCVGADVKLCSINQSINKSWRLDLCYYVLQCIGKAACIDIIVILSQCDQ